MESVSVNQAYGKYYYTHCCGANYVRTDEWLQFFRYIANRVKATVGPMTVLDAGCAKGFLVEAFREGGIEAYGIDISEYAIGESHFTVKPFLKVQSLAQPIQGRYDLVISIEVLEHMPSKDALVAIQNICAVTDDVVFSSSPFDYGEPTHINVHPPDYWAAEFARHGFYRDLDFDGSFLTPWASRFRRKAYKHDELVTAYERRFWEMSQAEHGARKHATEVQEHLARLQSMLDEENTSGKPVSEHITDLKMVKRNFVAVVSERDALAEELAALKKEQIEFWNSRAGALVRLLRGAGGVVKGSR